MTVSISDKYQPPIIRVAATALIYAGLIVLLHPLPPRHARARPNALSSHVIPAPQGVKTL